VDLLKRPAVSTLFSLFLFPRRSGEWASLLVECGEVCQYYFAIFETADCMDEADNMVLRRPVPRLFPKKARNSRVASRVPALLLSNFLTLLTVREASAADAESGAASGSPWV
jgi:hypothetical protein